MLTGVDTGFFFALEEKNPLAVEIWETGEIVISVIVLYELQKKLLQGHFEKWETIIYDVEQSTVVVPTTRDIAIMAGHIAHGTGMPALDALILSSFVKTNCREIYTKDPHFLLYSKKGIKIIKL